MNYNLQLSCTFIDRHPAEAAQLFERLPFEPVARFLKTLPTQTAATILKSVNPFTGAHVLTFVAPEETAKICQMLPLAAISGLLRRLDETHRQVVLGLLPRDISIPLQRVMRYAEGTVGAIMKTRILVLPDDITVRDGLERLRQNPEQLFDYTYIVDREQKLRGFIKLRHLMLAQSEDTISMVMKKTTGMLNPQMGQISILSHPGWRDTHALPVVDEKGVFLGAVSYITLRQLENEIGEKQPAASASDAGKALGELYWLGVSAFLKGATASIGSENKKR